MGKPPAPSVKTRAQAGTGVGVVGEFYSALERLDVDEEPFAIVGSWRGTRSTTWKCSPSCGTTTQAGRRDTGRSDACNSAYRFLWTDSGLRRPRGSRGRMLPIRTIRPKPDSHSQHPACQADQGGAPPFSGYNASTVRTRS
jgi:hypothetical protein